MDAGDVEDILNYLSEQLSEKNINTKNANAILVDYSVFDNDKKYVKNIINKLDKYSDTVSFVAVTDKFLTESDMDAEFYRISDIVSNNNNISGSQFKRFNMNGLKNNPGIGYFVYAVTFTK